MAFQPKSLNLGELFREPAMFTSRATWRAAGFAIIDPAKPTECMVASHLSAPGYLFKKYANDVSRKEQHANYEARIEGSSRLLKFIRKEDLRHVVAPQKYLHELPRTFGKAAQLLVVERLDVLGPDDSVLRYRELAEPLLRELLRVLARFKGLDSNAKNVPFLRDGRIAFVDLENWERRKDLDRVGLRNFSRYLSEERLALARRILDGSK